MTMKKEIDLSDRLCSGRPAIAAVNKDKIKHAVLLLELKIFTIAKLCESLQVRYNSACSLLQSLSYSKGLCKVGS